MSANPLDIRTAIKQIQEALTDTIDLAYRYRYPEAFETWQPSLRTLTGYNISDPRIKTPMVNAYDNATLYTDHVLAEIIALLKDSPRPGVLVFMSDHGENLFDDARLISGHAHDTAWDLRVPLLFWATLSYRERFPPIWQEVISHREAAVPTWSPAH